jgi:hypothetical protein
MNASKNAHSSTSTRATKNLVARTLARATPVFLREEIESGVSEQPSLFRNSNPILTNEFRVSGFGTVHRSQFAVHRSRFAAGCCIAARNENGTATAHRQRDL